MIKLENIGNLMYLYLDYIKSSQNENMSKFLVTATAKLLKEYGCTNYLPLIVKQIGEDQYEVIGNTFTYTVAKAADLERVWCIVTDDKLQTAEITKILSQEQLPKINLSLASIEEIKEALEFLIQQPNSPLKVIKVDIVASKISEAPKRQYWENLEPITQLKCGLTKGKKLDYLKQVFYLKPQPLLETKDEPDFKTLTVEQLKKLAKERGITGYSKLKKEALIKIITQA